ncbi:phage/plasmid primase, P4 family [Bacillus thuringiensis]|uniref:phage/plasmid primase, P4 family n=1 Tax=Bacillus thuringiensis TaxID=1428 RepID=UPI000BFC43B9|nr:phage/plasmid primase, P4 family [Bacillus thuringiensis]PGW47586.1 DNA primase [Bacillus thuringiensis]
MKKNPYNFNEIPTELKNLPQWVLWRKETRNGKLTKIPYQFNGEMAQANNRRTWSTFATAVKFYLEGDYDGIGFVFSRQDNYVGIDLDKCVVDGKTNVFSTEIIDTLDSYTEFSPSGKGIHIIIKGSLPQSVLGTGRKNTKHGLEIYSYGRYFSFTGNRENSNDVYERTDELAEVFETYFDDSDIQGRVNLVEFEKDEIKISNEALWERMFRSKKGDEIRSLFNGNVIHDDHSASDLSLMNHLAFWTGKSATRMDAMFRETSLMRDKWDVIHFSDTNETYGERTIGKAISSTSTTILDNKQQFEEFSFDFINEAVADVVEDKPKRKFKLTELGNAERIAYEYGHVIKFVNDIGWFIWDGKRWRIDTKKEIERITAKVLRSLFKSDDESEAKWARMCERRNVRMNSIKDLMPLVPGERQEFDTHKYLLNVENGIVDLKTGKIQQHDRELGLTKITNIAFDENAKCPEWFNFLDQILQGDKKLAEYMQRLIGYSLTGEITEQIMVFLIGGGSNGKSTFINIIKDIMGDYGRQAKSDTFIKKKETGANNDIARLVGSRFVSAIESEDGEQLSEAFVKQITGGEPVLARFLRQEFFEFIPEFKVFFTTNHKPVIKGVDEGIWRRIRLIPFNLQLPKEKRDKKLPEKLSLEMPGILNWAIEGCLKWQQSGLKDPAIVMKATGDYKEEMDILGPFMFECCFKREDVQVEARDLYEVYANWCFKNGEHQLKNRAFYRILESQGFKRERGNRNKYYIKGVTLMDRKDSFKQQKLLENDENSESVTKSNTFKIS